KPRQLRGKPQIRLVAAEAVNGNVGALDPGHRSDLSGNTLLPRQPFAEHHRLAGEQNRGALRIDRLLEAADAISGGVDRVVDDVSATGGVPDSRRDERP